MQYWNYQVVVVGNGNIDVLVVVVDDVVVVDGSVDFWEVFQCFGGGFDEEGYEVQVYVVVFFFEQVFVF